MSAIDISTDTKISQSNKRAFRNPWVLGWLALIAVVLGVNIVFITLAVVTNPGLVSKDYYERGRDHERHYIQRRLERTALGWTTSLEVPESIQLGATQTYRFVVVDKEGQPVQGASVVLNAFRPSDAKADFSETLLETAPGRYEGAVTFPLKGIWDLLVHVERDAKGFDVPRRISVLAQ